MSANSAATGLLKQDLETPALCLDLEAYHRNAARILAALKPRGIAWRPHMKGQKAPQLAKLAVEAGAIGVTCATVYEAEAVVDAGVPSVLLANQTVGGRKLARLARLAGRSGVMAATDSPVHLRQIASAAESEGVTIPVIIEVNVGMNRCGIEPGQPAVDLAAMASGLAGVRLAGLMGWEGHVLSSQGGEKTARIRESLARLLDTVAQCRSAGIRVDIVSAAGSGTFLDAITVADGITEVQAGGAVFSDLSYQRWGLDHEFALTVLTRVASRPSPTRIIVDGGFKTLSDKHGLPRAMDLPAVKSLVLSAEHGNIELEQPSETPRVGDTVEFIPGYTDSTVCLHDEMCVLREGRLEAVWHIPGRTGR
ncbi:MAG: DSD1 family PLP-dependent enzyme [Acidobacteria bacterium]|nr:DSD1 family PLP-dependent enzyme [Acidobacteriota bacterium]